MSDKAKVTKLCKRGIVFWTIFWKNIYKCKYPLFFNHFEAEKVMF
jgi:hypothetical protein